MISTAVGISCLLPPKRQTELNREGPSGNRTVFLIGSNCSGECDTISLISPWNNGITSKIQLFIIPHILYFISSGADAYGYPSVRPTIFTRLLA
jgi:hypothetical protein